MHCFTCRMLQESGSKLSVSEASLKEARSKSKEQIRRLQHLETELETRQRENRELLELTERQSERLVECQKDIETSRDQLQKLEAMVEKQKREVHNSFDDAVCTDLYVKHLDISLVNQLDAT